MTSYAPLRKQEACDALVDLELGHERMRFSTLYWAVWAGSSMLRLRVLDDFLRFVLNVYEVPHRLRQPPCFRRGSQERGLKGH